MKFPAIRTERGVIITSVLYPILLEIGLYYNVVWYVQLFNILLLALTMAILLILWQRLKPTLVSGTIVMTALSVANEFSIKARSVAFQFSDFFCLKDAARLSGRYHFIPTWGMLWALVFSGALLTCALLLLRNYHDRALRRRNLLRGASAISLVLPVAMFTGIENHNDGDIKFDINTFTRENGVLYSLFVEARQHGVQAPVGYDPAAAAAALTDGTAPTAEHTPNIIVIMNESLADYDLTGELDLTQDILPYIHSLDKNCLKGKALVSVYGGYTCNSEWEFLTGSSMAFLPVTCVPYNQIIRQRTDSLASSLHSLGYQTTALHPYHGVEWNRDNNYPFMGFDRFLTGEDFAEVTPEMLETLPEDTDRSLYFGDLEYIRGFISDAEDYRKIYEIMEEKEAGVPQFIFNVTIQNHGSYAYEGEDFQALPLCRDGDDPINQYLTVAHESDNAFRELTEYFSAYDEDTIILMFGDHQPALDMPYRQLYADAQDSIAVRETSYTVPYVIWANYDVDWEEEGTVSLGYLSAILKEKAGLPLDAWDEFRLSARRTYPAFNSYGALCADGSFTALSDAQASDVLREYWNLQYYRMFDQYAQETG